MEIYRQRRNTVEFQPPEGATLTGVTATLNDGDPITLSPIDPNAAVRRVVLPYVNHEGTVRVNWTFSVPTFDGTAMSTITHTYDVVTPILSEPEIREIHPNATASEVIRIEKAVRHVINAHTGQRFGLFEGVRAVRGSGGSALFLPERLLSLTSVDNGPGTNYVIDSQGYILRYFPWGVPPVKADFYGLHMHVGGVIHNPNNVHLGDWSERRTYEIDGRWGWEEVPSQVSEAAKLLVNDYACADQTYRDRYLTSMTAADWRIQFHDGAFAKTGNVRADQLLSDFVLKRGWAVI